MEGKKEERKARRGRIGADTKGRETDSDKWRKSPKLERQRSVSSENRRPLRARAPSHLAPWQPCPRHRSPSLGVVPRLGGATQPTPRSPVWLYRSILAGAWFQPRGEGRVPGAEECLRLVRGRGSWRHACRTPPPKAGPEDSQLERVEPGKRSWKGAGPYERTSPLRAGGALGCHKVNGRRWGVAVCGEAPSLPQLRSPRECPSRAAARAQGGSPHPGRVPCPWPLPALQTAAAAAAGSLPAAELTVSA